MRKKVTQLHDIDPDEFKKEILAGVEKQLKKFSKNFQQKKPTKWIGRKEAAELLGVSLPTIHNWSEKEILHPYKIGNRVRFNRSEIEQVLLNSNKKAP